jgi:hypothetical protein
MKRAKWKRDNDMRLRKAAELDRIDREMDAVMRSVRSHWGTLAGHIYDDPAYRKLKKKRDHLFRDLAKISYRHGGDRR